MASTVADHTLKTLHYGEELVTESGRNSMFKSVNFCAVTYDRAG